MVKSMANNENTKRIAKNTVFLYLRMFFLLLIGLYTVRVVLSVLGVEDYGIYNLVGSIVVLFSFINASSSASTQRYLNYALGENNTQKAQNVFNSSIVIHLFVALIILILSETVGLLLLNYYLVISEERMEAANWVYQFSVLTTVINILKIPYNATIIAYEKMSFFAFLSIIEGISKLLIVFLLKVFSFDKLILYSIFIAAISLILFLAFFIYVTRKFEISKFKRNTDKELYKELISFSGWNLISSVGDVVATQGLNFIVNRFYGVIVNAAMGIANQVNNAVYGLISNFQVAFEPQIVKSYAANDRNYLLNLIFKTSKFSYFLLYIFVLPLGINASFVLELWLKEVPEYSIIFLRLILVYSLFNSAIGPLWMVAYAIGNIRTYQIVSFFVTICQLPLLWAGFKIGLPAYTVIIIKILTMLFFSSWRLGYLYKRMDFPVLCYIKKVVFPIILITIISFVCTFVTFNNLKGLLQFFCSCTVSEISTILLCFFIGCNKDERKSIILYIKKLGNKIKK